MATAHLVSGFLGAGKTRFAKRLEQELPAILFGLDPPEAQFAECFARVDRLLDTVWPPSVFLSE